MINVFLAARPDAGEAASIARFAAEAKSAHRLKGNILKPGNLHVTLCELNGLKEPPHRVLETLNAVGAALEMPAFDVVFDRLLTFLGKPGHQPLVLTAGEGSAGLIALQRALIRAMHKQWLKVPAKPHYVPHMTLLYSDRALTEQPVKPIGWRVREFTLVRSMVGRATHEILGRWPLCGTHPVGSAP